MRLDSDKNRRYKNTEKQNRNNLNLIQKGKWILGYKRRMLDIRKRRKNMVYKDTVKNLRKD